MAEGLLRAVNRRVAVLPVASRSAHGTSAHIQWNDDSLLFLAIVAHGGVRRFLLR